MSTSPASARRRLDRAYAEAEQRFLHRKDVTGVDIGFVWKNGVQTKGVGVRVHVARKLALPALEPGARLPATVAGVRLDVIDVRYGSPVETEDQPDGTKISLPFVMGGMQCGRFDGEQGVVGAIVKDRRSGRPAILSSWQALAGPRAAIGDAILHPPVSAGGHPERDRVAELDRWMLDSDGDAAVATLRDGVAWSTLSVGAMMVIAGTRDPALGETLIKAGATGQAMQAVVDGIGCYRVPYEVRPGQYELRSVYGFKLVGSLIGRVSRPATAHNGSVWTCPATGDAVGLTFARPMRATAGMIEAVACEADAVFRRLNIVPVSVDDMYEDTPQSLADGAEILASLGVPAAPCDRAAREARLGLRKMALPRVGAMSFDRGPGREMPDGDDGPLADPRDGVSGLYDAEAQTLIDTVEQGADAGPDERRVRISRIWRQMDTVLTNAGYAGPGRCVTDEVATLIHGDDAHDALAGVINGAQAFRDLRRIRFAEIRDMPCFADICEYIDTLRTGVE